MLLAGVIVAAIAGLVGFAVTFAVLRSAHRIGVIAEVNERSSHTRPTPSGGGVGIVAGGTIGAALAAWVAPWPTIPFALLAIAIAVLGFLDDRQGLPVAVRLPLQLVTAGAGVALLPLDALAAAIALPLPALLMGALALIAAVYWINIFNFMDGIDGLAASEAAFIFAAAALLAISNGAPADSPMLWWLLAITVATLGFLVLNWPPARIFMGDAGSTYLGFMIAFAAFATIALGWLTIWQWLLLVALFVIDATLTLMRRLLRREPIFRAHRLHAYQHLSRRWGHPRVTGLVLAVNVIVLLPIAWVAGSYPSNAWMLVAGVYAVLVAALLLSGAGAPEKPKAA
jgi:Fuc2NAc and GlcNAc transferase